MYRDSALLRAPARDRHKVETSVVVGGAPGRSLTVGYIVWAPAAPPALMFRAAARHAEPRSSAGTLLTRARAEAIRGRERCREHASEALRVAQPADRATVSVRAASIVALLELGGGHVHAAADQLELCTRLATELDIGDEARACYEADRVEVLLALGREREARDAAAAQQSSARALRLPLPLATAARCRGILGDAGQFEAEFAAALALHELAADEFERARTHLCYGERLRRERRCAAARQHLAAALASFEQLGAAPWSERARRELDATSMTRCGRRDPRERDHLTPQELRVAEIIAGGATAREAAAHLYLSVKTVQAHLAHAYTKLDVHNRAQLVTALAQVKSARAAGTVVTRPPRPQ
jgi:DNA-binding CsgD family transcriptional regulator